jgi:hypothetical protein
MSATSDLVQQLYIAYYGRPADAAGLAYWTQQIDSNGSSVESVIGAFENSEEAQALHGPSQSVQAHITNLYMAFFGQEPDLAGMAYWNQVWESGSLTTGGLTLAILNAATGLAQDQIDERVQLANAFTAEMGDAGYQYTGAAAVAVGRTLMHTLADSQHTLQDLLHWAEDFACTANLASGSSHLFNGLYEYTGFVPLNLMSADIRPDNFNEHLIGNADSFGSQGAGGYVASGPEMPAPLTWAVDGGSNSTMRLYLTSTEDGTAGVYVGDALLGSNLSLTAGIASRITVSAQPTITTATLKIDVDGTLHTLPLTVILGTTGADTIVATPGQDLMFGDGGHDIFQLTAGGAINTDTLDQIGRFDVVGATSDTVAAGGIAGVWATAIDGWTLSKGMLSKEGATAADFYAAVQAATGVAGQVAGFLDGGNTYLFGEGVSSGDSDNVGVELVGIDKTDTISATASANKTVHVV